MSARGPIDREAGDGAETTAADARFHARARELVSRVGSADALEPRRAAAVATFVLAQTIVHAHNRLMCGGQPEPRVADLRTVAEAPRRTVEVIAARVLAGHGEDLTDAAWRVVRATLAVARRPEFYDTDEIPYLVAVAYRVGLELCRRDPEGARRLAADP